MRANQGAIRTFLRRLTRNHALADDLAQITFIKAYENWSKMDKKSDIRAVKAWLFSIAYRAFLDHYRTEKRRQALTEPPNDPIILAPSGSKIDIERAMERLSEDCRAAVMLNLAYGFSHEQCAKILQMPLGTVKSHIKRGKENLRTFLTVYESVV